MKGKNKMSINEDYLDFEEITEKLKSIFNLRFDYELAFLLNINPPNYASMKWKERIPFLPIIKLCNEKNIDLNEIFKYGRNIK